MIRSKIISSGGSLYCLLPMKICKYNNLKEGDEIALEVYKEVIENE